MLMPKPEHGHEVPKFRFSPNPNRAAEIRWREWSPEAFNEARAEKKPILLAISAVWCHWCHVMDETSYSDERAIALINEKFIPIRVDADQRPDIQNRYLLGGWPTTAILTDRGQTITGGTYIPPGQLTRLLEQTHDFYVENQEQLEGDSLRKREQILRAQQAAVGAPQELDRSLVNEVLDSLHRSFDSVHGGFGQAPKFPNAPAVELLLRRAYLKDEMYLLEMATITLDNMADGDVFDDAWGGFFRYATERDWSRPHYEKMLADNAALVINYLHGYQVSDHIRYREVAEKTLDYVDKFLAHHDTGGFSGSQDADDEFYRLGAEERREAKAPYIDPIVYVDWNAMMVSAYVEAFKVLGEGRFRDFAVKTVDYLLSTCYSPERGMAHYHDGEPHFLGWLSDQAHMIGALIDIYNVTGERSYMDTAQELVSLCERLFREGDGAFYDKAQMPDEETLGALFVRDKTMLENAVMARNLYRLAYLDGDERYERMAEQALGGLELGAADPIPAVALYALSVDEVLTQPVIFTVVGSMKEEGTVSLLEEAWRRYLPGKEVKFLDHVRDYELLQESGFPPEQHPALYPCIGRGCLPAVTTARELDSVLEDLPGRPR